MNETNVLLKIFMYNDAISLLMKLGMLCGNSNERDDIEVVIKMLETNRNKMFDAAVSQKIPGFDKYNDEKE